MRFVTLLTVACFLAFAAAALPLCAAQPDSPSSRIDTPLKRANEAVAAALAAPQDAARWTAADEAIRALATAALPVVSERCRRMAAAQTVSILSDEKRIAEALVDFDRRMKIEDAGMIALPFDAKDIDLLFELRKALLRFDSDDISQKLLALPHEKAKSIVLCLLSTGKAPGKTAVDEELTVFFTLGKETELNGSAEWDKAIDAYCAAVGGWRTACPARRVPAMLEASALACRARLGQDRDKAADTEYAAHATLLYGALDGSEAARRLFAEAQALRRKALPMIARTLYLLIEGDPAKSDDAYLARLEAAYCLVEANASRGQAIEEAHRVFRDGYAPSEIARVLYWLAGSAPPEENAFRIEILRTAAGGLTGDDKARALLMICQTFANMGREADAREALAKLKQEFPNRGYEIEAARFIDERFKHAP